jgi:serine/alanine adding enzyme
LTLQLITDPEKLINLGWSSFIAFHPEGSIFQSPEMYELFQKTGRMKPVVIGIADKKAGLLIGILSGVVIRELNGLAGYFTSRTVIYGGPLIDPHAADPEEILRKLLDGLINEVKNHSIFIQFRNFNSQEDKKAAFQEYDFNYRDRLNLIVDTSSFETVNKNMSESRLRQIRKGIGVGAKCIEPENIDQVREFYHILFNLYKYKVKKPLPHWDFFEQFYRISCESRLGIIRLVEYQGKIIGGILSPVTSGKTIYEWYVCGLDQQYKEVYPSVLATWAAIDYAVTHNIPSFDFMGVGIPERDYGVRKFKSRFGGELVNYGRFARINNKTFYLFSEMGYNLLAALKKI